MYATTSSIKKMYMILLKCYFKVYLYDEHFMQFYLKYFKTIFFMKNIIWLTFYRLLLNIDTALYLRSGKLQK